MPRPGPGAGARDGSLSPPRTALRSRWAGGDAGAAPDALGGVHREIGRLLRDRDAVGVGRGTGADGDEAAGLLDLVERTAVGDQVLLDREGAGAEGLDDDDVAQKVFDLFLEYLDEEEEGEE